MKRRRIQIDLRPEDELALDRARRVWGTQGDSETGRALLGLFSKLSAAIEQGTVVSFLPGDDPRAVDAIPEVTSALRPETRYRFLVQVPHPWRKQLSIKGRRITAGQLVNSMEANGWTVATTADQFDLDPLAVAEAVDYVSRNRRLIDAESAEQRRRTEAFVTHHAPADR
ncbi:MAG: hypothetical protein ACREM2_02770 [Vulcanimicrobiaceae bacterium]